MGSKSKVCIFQTSLAFSPSEPWGLCGVPFLLGQGWILWMPAGPRMDFMVWHDVCVVPGLCFWCSLCQHGPSQPLFCPRGKCSRSIQHFRCFSLWWEMKRGSPSSWFLKQSSPAGRVGNGDISGFDLNKEGFGSCFGKVLVLGLDTLCPWYGLGKLVHSQSQDKTAHCHWTVLFQLWQEFWGQECCPSVNCAQPSRRVHSLPGWAGIFQVTVVGSKRQHWSVKISVRLLKQELLKHPAQFSLPSWTHSSSAPSLVCFCSGLLPKQLLEGLFASQGAAGGRWIIAEPGFKLSLLLKR